MTMSDKKKTNGSVLCNTTATTVNNNIATTPTAATLKGKLNSRNPNRLSLHCSHMDLPRPNFNNSNSSPMSNPVLPEEIIAHIISFLSVKEILRMKSMCKSWNTLLSDSSFIKMHVKKSTPRPTLFLAKFKSVPDSFLLPFSTRRLPLNMLGPFPEPRIVGSCNGLLCFHGCSINIDFDSIDMSFSFWNPATQKISKKFGSFPRDLLSSSLKIAFGYDNLTDSYKIVAMHLYGHYSKNTSSRNEVKIFSSGDNDWRSLQSFPAIPLGYDHHNAGVYLNGTLNWLALHNNSGSIDWNTITVKQFVIVSLDLGTETYKQLLPPKGFDAVPLVEPTICTMMDCLCFVHDVKETHFVIWKMLEFGVEKSWTQYFKISYQNLQNGDINMRKHYQLLPLCLSKNGDALILANLLEKEAILYYWNDNRAERIKIKNGKWRHWHAYFKDYVESLAPTG